MKICTICYREFEEENMRGGSMCSKCTAIIGKGAGYAWEVSEEEADKRLDGLDVRKNKLIEEGKLEE